MESTITIPTAEGMRIKHVKTLHELQQYDNKNPFRHYCMVVSHLSGRSLQYLYTRCHAPDVVQAYNAGIKQFDRLNNQFAKLSDKPLPKEITIKGNVYELVDLERPNVSFIIDSDMSDFAKDPVRLACMCYIPKGTVYGEMNDAEDVLYPIQSRWEDFNDEFPLLTYLQLHAFFLRRFKKSGDAYMASQRLTAKLRKALSMIGFYRLTLWLKKRTSRGAMYSN